MQRSTVYDRISHLSPCAEAAQWTSQYTDSKLAWKECKNASWMVWMLRRVNFTDSGHRKIIKILLPSLRPYVKSSKALKAFRLIKAWTEDSRKCISVHGPLFDSLYEDEDSKKVASAFAEAFDSIRYGSDNYLYVSIFATEVQELVGNKLADVIRKHYPKPPRVRRPS